MIANHSTKTVKFDYDSIFEARIDELKREDRYRYFLDVNKSAQHFPKFFYADHHGDKKSAINWCSNDYLCMSVHEEVISKLSYAAHRSGAGSSGTRNISGTTNFHRELENTLAELHEKESALLFNGAYLANLTAISTLGKILPNCAILSDERNHASIIEGVKASGCEKFVFHHNDLGHLQQILAQVEISRPKIIVFESVYSMNGNISPIAEIVKLAKQYNALTYIDEVHAVGLYGERGAGLASTLAVKDQVDVINGTLAKGYGVIGGYIAAKQSIIDTVRSFGSGFIFTTSLPPAVCSAANRSIQILMTDKTIRPRYWEKVLEFRAFLNENGIKFLPNHSHITSVPIGDSQRCKKISDRLLKEFEIYIQPINYPTVQRGEECLRITLTMRHETRDMFYLAKSLKTVLNESA